MFKILKDKRISVIPYIIGTSLSYLLASIGVIATTYFNKILISFAEGTIQTLSPIILIFFILGIIIVQMIITNFFVNYLLHRFALKNYRHILLSLFKKSTSMSIPDYEALDKDKVMNYYLTDGTMVAGSIINVLGVGLGLFITIAIMLLINFITSFKVTLYSILIFIPFILVTKIGAKKLEKTSLNLAMEKDKALSKVKNYCIHKESVSLSGKEEYFKDDFDKSMDNFKDKRLKHLFWQKISYEMPNIIISLTPIIIILIATIISDEKNLLFSDIYFMTSIMIFIYEPLGQLVALLTQWQESLPYINRLIEFLDIDSNIDKSYEKIFSGDGSFLDGSGDLYGLDSRSLYSFDLDLPDRGFLVLKGPNGSGKSTFFKLLSKMMDPDLVKNKSFTINKKYKNNIGILFYPLFVFSGTVYENINYGKDIDNEKVNLFNLPDLNKLVIPDPINLSSGEKQKISLLRLFHQEKDIYLLDEPTSNLEKEAIDSLKDYIEGIKKDKLIIAIMHDDRYDHIADGFINIIGENMEFYKCGESSI